MNVLKAMIDLLDEERRSLLEGNYSLLEDLAIRKTAMAERLENSIEREAPDDCARLAASAMRNAELIAAARRGFRQAQAEVAEIRQGMAQATYGRDGMRRPLSRPLAKVEQKL